MSDSFKTKASFEVNSQSYQYYNLKALSPQYNIDRLPFSMKILLENLLRTEDQEAVLKKDIEAIARHFIAVFATKMNKKIEEIDPVFWDRLENYPWHGNIRELKNIIERAIILSYDQRLSLDCLPYDMQQASVVSHAPLSAFAMASVEKLHIQKVLNHTHGNKAEAARLLEIGIATLYRKIEQYRL